MKQLSILFPASIIIISTLFSSCGSDEPSLSKLELLTQKPWKLKNFSIVGLPASSPESFQADDTYTYSADGVYVFDEGATKEASNDPQTVTGSWEFAESETIIKLNSGGLQLSQEILELNSNTLKVKFNFIFDIEETFGH